MNINNKISAVYFLKTDNLKYPNCREYTVANTQLKREGLFKS